ncbi:hypothetical protein KYY02_12355 [Streptomyces pimonensis]|uniref:Uncharacterized protein n=1 Tax=Streptomyces pimonensis TaxID=2860288 RepID=A0ABV4J0X8_9ACTN
MTYEDDVTRLVGRVRREMDEELRDRVRCALADRSHDWLVEQLLNLSLSPSLPAPRDGQQPFRPEETEDERAARLARVRALSLDRTVLRRWVDDHRPMTREKLSGRGLLLDPPPKGGPVIGREHRSAEGEELLCQAKDVLYALLFGDEGIGVHLERVERELLTLTLPRAKAYTVACVLQAATEIGAHGTWRDPHGTSDDDRAANTVYQVEYGEITDELVGNGISTCLRLINELEVNEQVLYGRMENVEESTLA